MITLETVKGGKMPVYQTRGSSGADVYARAGTAIPSMGTVIVPVGVKISSWNTRGNLVPELQMRLRSSLAIKEGLIIPNGFGTIDADYSDEIGIILFNPQKHAYFVEKGQRVGQLVQVWTQRIHGVEILEEERTGGYGSTGRRH